MDLLEGGSSDEELSDDEVEMSELSQLSESDSFFNCRFKLNSNEESMEVDFESSEMESETSELSQSDPFYNCLFKLNEK